MSSNPMDQQADEPDAVGTLDNSLSPPRGPWSAELLKKAGKLPILEDDPGLRRSGRVKAQHRGFKGKKYADTNCIACGSDPPIISASIIKNIGITFCNVEPGQVSESALLRKKKASAPGEKKKPNIKKQAKNDVDKTPKKKSKK